MKYPGHYIVVLLVTLVVVSFTFPEVIQKATPLTVKSLMQVSTGVVADTSLYGNYSITATHQLGIDRFITDDGSIAMLFSDYSTGIVRRLFPDTKGGFVMGPGFNTPTPAELTLTFIKNKQGAVTGVSLRNAKGVDQFAQRVVIREEPVSFKNTDANLQGTLLLPSTKGPHPAIVLLHGSGPLTRYSFGPYPHFFTSLGFAVLIYDKRGAGSSTGTRMDASTGASMKNSLYPDELAGDALAAMRMLQQRKDIDPGKIGFWGSSEGGMLSMQVAARAPQTAFAINSSGFMEPLWQTLRYQARAIPESKGASPTDVDKDSAFVDLWLHVARTGDRWEDFKKGQQLLTDSGRSWIFQSRGPFTSLEQLRWDWDHILSFDPQAALAKIKCPVLGLFGGLDPLTPAQRTTENMRRVLTQAGHKDFTLRIFPGAGHSLSVLPHKDRMAPAVFETLRSWLLAREQAK